MLLSNLIVIPPLHSRTHIAMISSRIEFDDNGSVGKKNLPGIIAKTFSAYDIVFHKNVVNNPFVCSNLVLLAAADS